jgi:SAM-dependent methyltransferase
MIVVVYTTRYRDGGDLLARAAHTLAEQRREAGFSVVVRPTETKRAFVDSVQSVEAPIQELHFIGHSGMYGPMFGTTDLPEQFSPHEWRQLSIPFESDATASFHACRTGRWFAPFFARTFGVVAHGHHWYTTFSLAPDRYRRVPHGLPTHTPVYVVGQPGRKSHGLLGSVGKHLGLLPPVPIARHAPASGIDGAAYDRVAHHYDATFQDIRVRGPEWRWLSEHISPGAHVLDLGCGTGALLRAFEDRHVTGVGADVSPAMLDRARAHRPDGEYVQLDGPGLPFGPDRFDFVVSLLSWRYLDWDPILPEVARVLKPGGRLLLVDMVARPADLPELPTVLLHKLAASRHERRFPGYRAARARLVSDPAWAQMLHYNPIRAEHEYRWFLESRFPGRRVETLNLARHSRILAFDSGPITTAWFPPQSYP